MKKLLIVPITLLMLNSFGQQSIFVTQRGQSFRGFVLMENNDTVKGDIVMLPQWQMQPAPPITDDAKKYPACNAYYAKYYEMSNGLKWFSSKFSVLKAPDDPKRPGGKDFPAFLLVDVAGPITLFSYEFLDESVIPPKEVLKSYMQTPKGEAMDISGFLPGFPKKMSVYLADYPELAAKVTNKEKGYGFLNINNIVKEYNKWYMEKNPTFTLFK